MQAKRPALVTQKDLILSATRWKLVRMEFPGGVRKRFPVAVIEHTCHAKKHTRSTLFSGPSTAQPTEPTLSLSQRVEIESGWVRLDELI